MRIALVSFLLLVGCAAESTAPTRLCDIPESRTVPMVGCWRLYSPDGKVLPYEFAPDTFVFGTDTTVSTTRLDYWDYDLMANSADATLPYGRFRFRQSWTSINSVRGALVSIDSSTYDRRGTWAYNSGGTDLQEDSVRINGGPMLPTNPGPLTGLAPIGSAGIPLQLPHSHSGRWIGPVEIFTFLLKKVS